MKKILNLFATCHRYNRILKPLIINWEKFTLLPQIGKE